jgi:hypothetical protein
MPLESGAAAVLDIAALIQMPRQMCLTESALGQRVVLAYRYRLNGPRGSNRW